MGKKKEEYGVDWKEEAMSSWPEKRCLVAIVEILVEIRNELQEIKETVSNIKTLVG